jgi:hypothetical protein
MNLERRTYSDVQQGEAAAENEVEIEGKFDEAIALGGDNIKTDVVFTPEATGKLEVEFQAATGSNVTVTQNETPGTAPAGFKVCHSQPRLRR